MILILDETRKFLQGQNMSITLLQLKYIWAVTWQNQQNECAPSEDSDQPGLYGKLRTQAFFVRTAKTLIRLDGCPGWYESSLDAHAILLVLSCCSSYIEEATTELHKKLVSSYFPQNIP